MISSLGKQGGRRSQMGNTSPIFVGRLLSVGTTEAVIPPIVEEVTGGGGYLYHPYLYKPKLIKKAEAVVKKIKKAKKTEAIEIFEQSADIIEQLKHEIRLLDIRAHEAQIANKRSTEAKTQQIIARLEAQIEEIDTVFVMFMMIANLD